jgi:hypothetical protein
MITYTKFDTVQTIHSFTKSYPGLTKLYIYDTPINVKIAGFELRKPDPFVKQKIDLRTESDKIVSDLDSLRRTKTTISDITLCNEFDLFCTFTFAADRHNVDKCKSKMSNWLKRQRETYGSFHYIIVPEFHKDGKAIHFHALFKNYKGVLSDSGHKINKRTAYNITSYQSGYSTAVKIDDIQKVSSYIKKYITKDMPLFPGKKRYWVSTRLKRPVKVQNPKLSPADIAKFTPAFKLKNLTIFTSTDTIQIPTNERPKYGHTEYRQRNKPGEYYRPDLPEVWQAVQAGSNFTRQRIPDRILS